MDAQARALGRFREIEQQLPALLERLLACPPHRAGQRPAVPKVPGVYVFTDGGAPRYVGRTRNCNSKPGATIASRLGTSVEDVAEPRPVAIAPQL